MTAAFCSSETGGYIAASSLRVSGSPFFRTSASSRRTALWSRTLPVTYHASGTPISSSRKPPIAKLRIAFRDALRPGRGGGPMGLDILADYHCPAARSSAPGGPITGTRRSPGYWFALYQLRNPSNREQETAPRDHPKTGTVLHDCAGLYADCFAAQPRRLRRCRITNRPARA